MSSYGICRLLPHSSRIYGFEQVGDQRKLTKKSTPNDNMMIMHYDICYLIIELFTDLIEQLNLQVKATRSAI